MRSSFVSGLHDARFAKNTKVMRHAGFGFAAIEGGATNLPLLDEPADDAEADGVAEGIEDLLDGDLFERRLFKGSHDAG